MGTEKIIVLIALACAGLVALVMLIISTIRWVKYARNEKLKKEFDVEYPALSEKIETSKILVAELGCIYENEINPKMEEIDFIVDEQRYMTKEAKEKSELDLEVLRDELSTLRDKAKGVESSIKDIFNLLENEQNKNPEIVKYFYVVRDEEGDRHLYLR